jgi:hypothetical protein
LFVPLSLYPKRVPPNGLELSCPAEAGNASLLYGTPAGKTSIPEDPARRVSFSELLGSGSWRVRGGLCRRSLWMQVCIQDIDRDKYQESKDPYEGFVPVLFHLCPSCSQKRTLLFGEYMNQRLLLRLPHCQMVFTFPKALRGFFRYHPTLFGEIARQLYAMIATFYNAAAACKVHSAAVIAYASAGEFARFNPHLHAIVLEGSFDPAGRFVHIPQLDLARLSQHFRASMVSFFLERELINQRLACNMLQWDHSGFSMGTAHRQGLRGRPPPLPPLWLADAHRGGDHRTPAGAQDPPSPDQDRKSTTGSRPGLLELNLLPLPARNRSVSPCA